MRLARSPLAPKMTMTQPSGLGVLLVMGELPGARVGSVRRAEPAMPGMMMGNGERGKRRDEETGDKDTEPHRDRGTEGRDGETERRRGARKTGGGA